MRLPAVGELFVARYLLEREIGEGGFAKVFGARDAAGALVAVKVLAPTSGGYAPETIARFDREVAILAQLRDPHTVRMLESGRSPDGLLYVAFEYVPGRDLSEVLEQDGPLSPEAARHVLEQVLASLHEAHVAGLLHRDIKPENIRIFSCADDAFCVKLLDFGIAKSPNRPDAPSITRTGELVGTPRYMSPEQLLSRPLTPASDIYSLGLVMCEALMGRDFLHGNRWTDQLERVRSGHVMSVPELERIGPAFYEVLQRMVETNPARRLGSAAAVLNALAEADTRPLAPVRGAPIHPDPRTGATATVHRAPARVSVMPYIAGGLLAFGVVAGLAWWLSRDRMPPPPREVTRVVPSALLRTAEPEEPVAPSRAASPAPEVDQAIAGPCGAPAPFTGFGDLGSVAGGERMRWLTYIPSSYDPGRPHPLVVILHPDHIQPKNFVQQLRFDQIAEQEGVVLVAPFDGELQAWREPGDVAMVHSAVLWLQDELCIDANRVYALGHNNGGYAAERLSCEPWIAATAASSYRPGAVEFFCEDPPPAPFLLLAPMKSGHAPLEGGVNCYGTVKISHAEGFERWKARNNCNGPPKTHFKHKKSKCFTWECDAPFVGCELDGGHGWPGSPVRPKADWRGCDGKPPDFPSERVVWDFFAAQQLAGPR